MKYSISKLCASRNECTALASEQHLTISDGNGIFSLDLSGMTPAGILQAVCKAIFDAKGDCLLSEMAEKNIAGITGGKDASSMLSIAEGSSFFVNTNFGRVQLLRYAARAIEAYAESDPGFDINKVCFDTDVPAAPSPELTELLTEKLGSIEAKVDALIPSPPKALAEKSVFDSVWNIWSAPERELDAENDKTDGKNLITGENFIFSDWARRAVTISFTHSLHGKTDGGIKKFQKWGMLSTECYWYSPDGERFGIMSSDFNLLSSPDWFIADCLHCDVIENDGHGEPDRWSYKYAMAVYRTSADICCRGRKYFLLPFREHMSFDEVFSVLTGNGCDGFMRISCRHKNDLPFCALMKEGMWSLFDRMNGGEQLSPYCFSSVCAQAVEAYYSGRSAGRGSYAIVHAVLVGGEERDVYISSDGTGDCFRWSR